MVGDSNLVGGGETQNGGLLEGITTEGFLSSPFLSNLGAGILAANRDGQPLGSAVGQGLLAANRGQQEALKNQAVRDELTARQRKRSASSQLQNLLAEGNVDPRDPRVIGLLAEISPDAVAQGLLGQAFPAGRRQDSVLARLEAAGIDPQSAEGQDLIRQSIGGGGDGGSKEVLDAMLKTLQIQALQGDLEKADTEGDRKRITGRISTINSIERTREAIELNRRLRGTLGETGIGFNALRSTGAELLATLTQAFGGDASKARQVAADLQRFRQITTTEALQSLFGGQVSAGTITDSKLGTFLTTKPGIDRLPEVNDKIFADMLQSSLDSADSLGISIPDREKVELEIERLRGVPAADDTSTNTTEPPASPEAGDAALLRDFSAAFPEFGRDLNEVDIRKAMREREMTRQQVINEMGRLLKERQEEGAN